MGRRQAQLHLFGTRLESARSRMGWNQEELAQEASRLDKTISIQQGYVSTLENSKGEKLPSVRVLLAIASATGVLTSYLLGEVDEPQFPDEFYTGKPVTAEGEEIAAIVDNLPLPQRQEILTFTRSLNRATRDTRVNQERVVSALLDLLSETPELRSRAMDIISSGSGSSNHVGA